MTTTDPESTTPMFPGRRYASESSHSDGRALTIRHFQHDHTPTVRANPHTMTPQERGRTNHAGIDIRNPPNRRQTKPKRHPFVTIRMRQHTQPASINVTVQAGTTASTQATTTIGTPPQPDRSACPVSQRRKRHGRRRPSTTVAPKSQPGERPIKKRYPGLSAFPGRLHRDRRKSGTSRHSMTVPVAATAIATIIATVRTNGSVRPGNRLSHGHVRRFSTGEQRLGHGESERHVLLRPDGAVP